MKNGFFDFFVDFFGGAAVEGGVPTQQNVHDNPTGPHVYLLIVLLLEDFRGHVVGGPYTQLFDFIGFEEITDAKIDDFNMNPLI